MLLSQKKNMQQTNRKCHYHPENGLHNFCVNTECSVPLCPKCINIHLSQSPGQRHQIKSMSETIEMVRQQLDIAIEGISHNLQTLQEGEFAPHNCFNHYSEIIENYRQQALGKINSHYDYIKKQLYQQLQTKYSSHLATFIQPLQSILLQLKKNRTLLDQKPIECMIKVISQQIILHVERMLEKIDVLHLFIKKDKKQVFKLELPKLEGIEGNMLKIVPGGIENILSRSLGDGEGYVEKQRLLGYTGRYLSEIDEMERINRLQAQLQKLRGGECY